jgi:hypothetical protein
MPRFGLLLMQRAGQAIHSDSDETNSSAEDDDELVYSSEDNDYEEDSDESEVEPPHPLGFRSWGRTRFGLNPVPTETMERFKRQKGYLYPHGYEDGLDDWSSGGYEPKTQQFPPISSYIDPKTASTQSLVRYAAYDSSKRARGNEFDRPVEDDEMDKISQLFQAAAMIEDTTVRRILASPQQKQQLKSVPFVPEDMSSVQREMDEIRRRMERDHLEAAQALKMIIRRNEQEAEKIIATERRRDEESEREEQAQRQKEEQKVAEDQEAEDKEKQKVADKEELENEKNRRAQEKKDQQRQNAKDQSDAAEAAIAKDREYILKAEKLIGQLVQVRASVEPFENSKALSKRRLGMKKIVNGKVNTLSENVDKIKSVAAEVSQAIGAARAEDENIKQQGQAGNRDLTPEMARGKRYLVDLLSSSVIKRVQAEGFNG